MKRPRRWNSSLAISGCIPASRCRRRFNPPNCSDGAKMGDIPQGAGASLTYNFTPPWGLEADYGGNKNKNGADNTVSIGPRFAWRNEGVTFFAHTLLGYNRLTVPLRRHRATALAQFWAAAWISISGAGCRCGCLKPTMCGRTTILPMKLVPRFPSCGVRIESGVRLRTGLVFNFGFRTPLVPAAAAPSSPAK